MKSKMRIRLIIDIAMTAALLLMTYEQMDGCQLHFIPDMRKISEKLAWV